MEKISYSIILQTKGLELDVQCIRIVKHYI